MIERWLVAVRDHPERPAALQRLALHMLALRLDWHTGRGFASVAQIAADTDATDRTVKRATAWARGESAGLLLCTRRGHRLGNGQRAASEWQLIMPPSQGVTDVPLTSQGDNGSASRGQQSHLKGTAETPHQELELQESSASARGRASPKGPPRARGPRSEACKAGDHQLCAWTWCTCTCTHRGRQP